MSPEALPAMKDRRICFTFEVDPKYMATSKFYISSGPDAAQEAIDASVDATDGGDFQWFYLLDFVEGGAHPAKLSHWRDGP